MPTAFLKTLQNTPGKWRMYTLVMLCLCIATLCNAQTKKQEDIDEDYQKCSAKDTSCAAISACAYNAYEKWEKQMTLTYKKLLKELKKENEKAALKKAQAAWVAYKEATFASYDFMFNIPGSKWCQLRHEARIDIVRRRTLELRDYYDYLKKR